MIKLSIVIPTYNRRGLLSQVLDSLCLIKIDFKIMEVIIIDDGSTDQTITMLQSRQDPYRLRWFRHDQSQGPAIARNRGAKEATGEILAFLDSDIIIDPKWWQAAVIHFEDPTIAGVEGATIPFEATTVATPFTHIVSNTNGGNFLTCNMLYRRKRFLELGGFDQRFMRANREDSDLGFSFLERGHQLVFEPACIVNHPIVESAKTVYFKEARYGLHEALLRRKHPDLYKRYLKWIDGRAFPVFYWGIYIGMPTFFVFAWYQLPWAMLMSLMLWGLGITGSVYAVCRKRKVTINDIVILLPQYLIIPWVRLFWIVRGEWRYRNIKSNIKTN